MEYFLSYTYCIVKNHFLEKIHHHLNLILKPLFFDYLMRLGLRINKKKSQNLLFIKFQKIQLH